jgi:predicted kinase
MVSRFALVIILGNPASGKTRLAQRLAAALKLPHFDKDDIKEALFDALGCGDRAWSADMSRASFHALLHVARTQGLAGLSSIVDGNWRPEHRPLFERLFEGLPVDFAQVRCEVSPALAAERFAARRRHPGHLDALVGPQLERAAASAPEFLELRGPRWTHDGAHAAIAGSAAAALDLETRLGAWLPRVATA